MADNQNFAETFARLRAMLKRHSEGMTIVHDNDTSYYLDTPKIHPKNKKPIFFAAVVIMKNYVSFHYFPVYMFPDLVKDISPEMKKRMQGKSCFNFKIINDEAIAELESIIAAGRERVKTWDWNF